MPKNLNFYRDTVRKIKENTGKKPTNKGFENINPQVEHSPHTDNSPLNTIEKNNVADNKQNVAELDVIPSIMINKIGMTDSGASGTITTYFFDDSVSPSKEEITITQPKDTNKGFGNMNPQVEHSRKYNFGWPSKHSPHTENSLLNTIQKETWENKQKNKNPGGKVIKEKLVALQNIIGKMKSYIQDIEKEGKKNTSGNVVHLKKQFPGINDILYHEEDNAIQHYKRILENFNQTTPMTVYKLSMDLLSNEYGVCTRTLEKWKK